MGYWSDLKAWLFKDPVKLIRYLVLFICSIIVITQLYECFSKLYSPPISTHSYYSLNETIEMPAVTICREPPYKMETLSEISRSTCLHPKYTTCWINYPYDDVPLDEFFTNSTFNLTETFFNNQYGLKGLKSNVDIISSMHFYMGRCHTIKPKIDLARASRSTGYSMILTHHVNSSESKNIRYENEPGWHLFIHDQRENFTEINVKGLGRVDYVFADLNEEIEIKLQTQYFSNVETPEKSCSREQGYSDLKCGEMCVWRDLVNLANCSGPWMSGISERHCTNYKSMKNLTSEYSKVYYSDDDVTCNCAQPCQSRIFSTYVQNRKSFYQPRTSTQIWIYYTTNLVSMIEERPSYDTTQFIADVGGSLGFLLGLSVLGIIGILEHLTLFFCGGFIKNVQMKHEKHAQKKLEADQTSQSSAETLDVAIAQKDSKKLPL